ncbi:Hypothetical_protein [Hexamita inflata]|uniref:Hypothetical_protein n=1 Tax=Hexamita inflata TaxID=28002 RepID=A0AA86UTK5_9EUKA|nr:Hypothetical protein HINF_LOCUS36948 [Hexamita inflata]
MTALIISVSIFKKARITGKISSIFYFAFSLISLAKAENYTKTETSNVIKLLCQMFNQQDKHQKVSTELQKLVGKNSELVKHWLHSTFLTQLTFLVQIQIISKSIPCWFVLKALEFQVITTFSANIEVQILECECIIQINCYFIIRGQGKTNSFNQLQPYQSRANSITVSNLIQFHFINFCIRQNLLFVVDLYNTVKSRQKTLGYTRVYTLEKQKVNT